MSGCGSDSWSRNSTGFCASTMAWGLRRALKLRMNRRTELAWPGPIGDISTISPRMSSSRASGGKTPSSPIRWYSSIVTKRLWIGTAMSHLPPPFYAVGEAEILPQGDAWRESGTCLRVEDLGYRKLHLREGFQRDRISSMVRAYVLIPLRRRAAVDEEGVGIQVDQPGFGDACRGVEGNFVPAVARQGRIRDLDYQQDILIFRRLCGQAATWPDQDQIRLRAGFVAFDPQRILRAQQRSRDQSA